MSSESYISYIKNIYARWAGIYDLMTFFLLPARNKIVKLAGIPKNARILDVATGTGKQAFAFGKKGYSVVGIDISDSMLKIARKHNKYQNIIFEMADAAILPYKDNEFDVATVSWALHDMPREIRQKVIREMSRVTQKQGVLVFVDYATPSKGFRRWIISSFIPGVESREYSEYIQISLKERLKQLGFQIESEVPVVFGLGTILKAVNTKAGS